MPEFRYDPYSNPYAASIGQLLLEPGRIEAARAQTVGAAQAHAAQVTGQAYGSAVQSIGQNVAQTIEQAPARQAQAQQVELQGIQLDQAKRENRSRNIFEAELRNPGNYKPDGTVDEVKVADRLKKQDVGAWEHWTAVSTANQKNALETRKLINEIQTSDLTIDEKQRKAQEAQAEYLGKLAYSAIDILQQKPEDRLHARDTAMGAVARAAADGMITPDQAKGFLMQTAQATPAQLADTFGSFIPADLRSKLDKERAETAEAQGRAAEATARAASGGQTGNAAADQRNARETALGIQDGTVSPTVLESTRATSQGMALSAELHRLGVDSDSLLRNWMATKKAIASLNSTQQIRLTEGITKASASLDRIEELNTQLGTMMSRFGVKAFNKAQLALAKNGTYGKDVASVAQRLEGQIADVTGEIGTVIMGGGSPTDHGLELAGKNLSSDWDQQVLTDSITQVRYNLRLAQNARNELLQKAGVTSTQGATPPAGASEIPKDVTDILKDVPPGDYKAPDGVMWRKAADGSIAKAPIAVVKK